MKRISIIIYLAIGAIHVLGHFLDQPDMTRFTKPMLMPALLFMVYTLANGHVTMKVLLLSLAIVFSWLGDLALMQDTEMFFLLGIGGFLLAQLTYVFLYYKATFSKPEFRLMPIVPVLVYMVFFMIILVPNLPGDLKIPVIVYAVCITAMASMSRLRLGLTSEDSYQWVMMGSLLFVVSDSIIAFDKFYRPMPFDSEIIMSTYIGAQILIALGIMDHPE